MQSSNLFEVPHLVYQIRQPTVKPGCKTVRVNGNKTLALQEKIGKLYLWARLLFKLIDVMFYLISSLK